jgi:cellulose 1,4-beta-cellobiosidase
LDLAPFLADAVQRGSLDASWYLLEVQMGFEIWSGGIGLGVNNLSMSVTSK